jgi:hypothetical protein
MPGDAELLATLRTLVDERPTYGYRRNECESSRMLEFASAIGVF